MKPLPGDNLVVPRKQGGLLLSGGIDSAVSLALMLRNHWRITPLHIDYHQRSVEVQSAEALVCFYRDHPEYHPGYVEKLLKLQMPSMPSRLTTEEQPAVRTLEEIRKAENSPYIVPGRNLMMLSIAVAYAQAHGLGYVFIATNLEDQVGFPDCRDGWLERWGDFTEAMGPRVEVRSVLSQARKEDVVQIGYDLCVPLHLTTTCYYANKMGTGCGRCDACMLRREAHENRGLADPCRYPKACSD